MAIETSLSVRLWADETFGELSDMSVLLRRARMEFDELEEAVRTGQPCRVGEEAADVVILLHRLAALHGRELSDEVDAKMAVNRSRTWRTDGLGTGRHE